MKKFIIIGIFLLVLSLVGCSVEISAPLSTFPEVVYKVSGTAITVNVTLNNASGGTEQYGDVQLVFEGADGYEWVPVTYSYSSFTDNFLYISAQNQGEVGSVRVDIYVNGQLFKTSRSSGAYVIATASGSRP